MMRASQIRNVKQRLLISKPDLARGGKDKFHRTPLACRIVGDKCVEAALKSFKGQTNERRSRREFPAITAPKVPRTTMARPVRKGRLRR